MESTAAPNEYQPTKCLFGELHNLIFFCSSELSKTTKHVEFTLYIASVASSIEVTESVFIPNSNPTTGLPIGSLDPPTLTRV